MKQIAFTAKHTAALRDVGDRMPNVGEVKVKMCYTAVSAGTERDNLSAEAGYPRVLGYSGSGIVEAIGEGVQGFSVGDRVMIHGANHQEYGVRPAGEIVKLPDNVSLEVGALTIISGFSMAAVRKAKIELGDSLMVVGLGLLGLFAVQMAHINGAYPVIAVDMNPERRELALSLGADFALDPTVPDYREQVRTLTYGKGVNKVIEVTGNGKALSEALAVTAKFGRVILLGCTRTPTEINFYRDVHVPGIELVGAHSGARPVSESFPGYLTEYDDCRVILRYLSAGRLSFDRMICEIHSPTDAPDVYKRLFEPNFPIGVLFDWQKKIAD